QMCIRDRDFFLAEEEARINPSGLPKVPAAAPGPTPVVHTTAVETAPPKAEPKPTATPAVAPLPLGARTQDERNSTSVFKAAAPATVFVTQSQVVYDRYSMKATEAPAGTGTGFVWDDQGHIVTNCHVALPNCELRNKPKLKVTLYDQQEYAAELVGFDAAKDIAVLKISAPGELTELRRPPSDYELEVGQKTLAIGNPFGLDHTLTVGVVSALGREVKGVGGLTIRDMVQTDAAINPGNSGGPLLNSAGELIGMNTMIFSASGSSAGIGFAVPVTTIKRLVPQLIRSGRAERVGLGVGVLSPSKARRLGVTSGVIIRRVPPGSPAAKAGLRSIAEAGGGVQYDIIVAVGETRIKNFDDLYGALEAKNAGDKVEIMVERRPSKTVETVEVELARLK
ncbi:MAG: trypsin-like peptidase domain-containing protein, partial [Nannocystaceae bacterium]|nr:trypsin-like peptidase domain-containing protein [Nannocystaceae bacterium]